MEFSPQMWRKVRLDGVVEVLVVARGDEPVGLCLVAVFAEGPEVLDLVGS
jgi:hypothetical protein